MRSTILSLATTLLVSGSALAAPTSANPNNLARRAISGQATFYGNAGDTSGTCSFDAVGYKLPAGLFGTALSDSNWDNAANCGGCVKVNYGGKSITAMIINQCPGCGPGHLDLLPDAFTQLADKSKGILDVTWDYVPCTAVTGPITIHMKSGSSQSWFSAQVVNANDRTKTLEVSSDGGKTFKPAQRQSYNYFQLSSGTGSATATIRVTSVGGKQVVIPNVQLTSDSKTQAPGNY